MRWAGKIAERWSLFSSHDTRRCSAGCCDTPSIVSRKSVAKNTSAAMPELPDISVYMEALKQRLPGTQLQSVRVNNLFVVRTADPPIEALEGRAVLRLRRLGKRIAIAFEDDLWLVMHLMIAGRLHWNRPTSGGRNKNLLCELDFESGRLALTEAGSQRRASLHVVGSAAELVAHDPGGLEVLESTLDQFAAAITARNHTLKRALTNPSILSGIGNSFSDEILHAAKLSPVKLTQKLTPEEIHRLYEAVCGTLRFWIDRLCAEAAGDFPSKVTAFRKGMAVHGRFGQPCPTCGVAVQRIRYASNETNYCPGCQTEGRILSDRSLARLLKDDWPNTVSE